MKLKSSFVLMGLVAGLAACQQQVPEQAAPAKPVESTKVVEYLCGAKSNKALNVTYHFVDQKAVSAEVALKGKAYKGKFVRDNEDQENARFENENHVVWVADSFDLNSIEKAKGGMLYKKGKSSDQIIVKYCSEPKSVK